MRSARRRVEVGAVAAREEPELGGMCGKAFNGKVDEKENRDSLILELSDSSLFIVL